MDRLVEMDSEISYDLYTAGMVNLHYCNGCWNCMTKGHDKCPVDHIDDMAMLKRKMKVADFIVFGTPIYTAHMSGQMKTFFDRLAAWYHTIQLAGKPGAAVITTASIHQMEVHQFMKNLMGCLGMKVVATLDTNAYFPGMMKDRDEAQKAANKAADAVLPYIAGEKTVDSDDFLEECFKIMKNKSVRGREWLPGDYAYWKKNGMLEIDSYADLIKHLRTRPEKKLFN